MARDVFKAFSDIIADGSELEVGDAYLEEMKHTGRWSEDVW